MTETLATKQDSRELGLAVKQDLRAFTLEMKRDMDEHAARVDTRLEGTKHELAELRSHMDARFEKVDTRFEELERRINLSTAKQIADLRSQMFLHMIATIGAVSALVKLL